jgi:hypothetical protein
MRGAFGGVGGGVACECASRVADSHAVDAQGGRINGSRANDNQRIMTSDCFLPKKPVIMQLSADPSDSFPAAPGHRRKPGRVGSGRDNDQGPANSISTDSVPAFIVNYFPLIASFFNRNPEWASRTTARRAASPVEHFGLVTHFFTISQSPRNKTVCVFLLA